MTTRKSTKKPETKKPTGKVGIAKKAKSTKKVGNPSFVTKYSPGVLEEVQKLATIGCSNNDIAWILKIHPTTFRRWINKHEPLCDAVEMGIADRNTRLRKSMFDAAIGGNPTMQIWLSKQWLGMRDKQEVEHSGSERKPLALIIETKPPNGKPNDNGPEKNADTNGDG